MAPKEYFMLKIFPFAIELFNTFANLFKTGHRYEIIF